MNPPTICKCGSAQSYHRPSDNRDHEYEPRYDPVTWAEADKAGRDGLDVERLARALDRYHAAPGIGGIVGYNLTTLDEASAIAAEYLATPSDTPKEPT